MAQQTYGEWMRSNPPIPNLTAVEWLQKELHARGPIGEEMPIWVKELFEQAKQMEKEQISKAMMYALDEDGHTGDWKVKFINDYYESNFGVRPE